MLIPQAYGPILHQWHSSMGDPIYAIGSQIFAGKDTSENKLLLKKCLTGLATLARQPENSSKSAVLSHLIGVISMPFSDSFYGAARVWMAHDYAAMAIAHYFRDNTSTVGLEEEHLQVQQHLGCDHFSAIACIDMVDQAELALSAVLPFSAADAVINKTDKIWKGKYSSALMMKELGPEAICRLGRAMLGDGVSPEDDPLVEDRFRELGISTPAPIFEGTNPLDIDFRLVLSAWGNSHANR